MWILSFPFIMYEHKCYKLAAVKTSMSVSLRVAQLLPSHRSGTLNIKIHEHSAGRQNRKRPVPPLSLLTHCNFIALL